MLESFYSVLDSIVLVLVFPTDKFHSLIHKEKAARKQEATLLRGHFPYKYTSLLTIALSSCGKIP